MQRTILCYGDSNTWGYVPQNFTDKNMTISRYPFDKRWPGILQSVLGKNYHVIEEGLNSRTTNLDYHIPPDRNGKNYLAPCLYSHAPVDLIILALGTNDLKTCFNRTSAQIGDGITELVNIIQNSMHGKELKISPDILLLPPVVPLPLAEKFYTDENGMLILKGAIAKAIAVIPLYRKIAEEKKCHFLDTTNDLFPSEIDGVHYNADEHKKLSTRIAEKIKGIFSENKEEKCLM